MLKLELIIAILISAAVGFLLGAAAIHRPITNAPLELPPARNPLNPKDLMGLIGSLGIRTLAGHLEALPPVVLETDRTFALEIPEPRNRIHYVLVPKKDIGDISQISKGDEPYLTDVFLVSRKLIEQAGLSNFQIYTNGPGRQQVGYLHFHLVGRRPGGK